MNLFRLTRELIDIPSVSGDEKSVVDFLDNRLRSLGFNVERQSVAPRRENLIATRPPHPPRVVLSTHTDTVPPHIPASEDDEYIYGRGACDTKGIIAAQLCAARKLIAEGITDFGMLFTVDEEMSSEGARAANEHTLAYECRFLINGEPTDNKLATACKGSLRVRLHAEGRAAHSAYPEHGESAITKLLDVLADIRAARFPRDELLGDSTCNIGVIAGGTRPNVIPAAAHADLQIRLVTDSEIVKGILEKIIAGRVAIEYLSAAEPVRLHTIEGFAQCVVRFTTDLSYLHNWGTPLLFGPGSILDAHTAHERISKAELTRAAEDYAALVRQLLQDSQSVKGLQN